MNMSDIIEKMLLDISLLGFEGYKAVAFESMDGYGVLEENTFGCEKVKMHSNALPEENAKGVTASLEPLSFNVIRVENTK